MGRFSPSPSGRCCSLWCRLRASEPDTELVGCLTRRDQSGDQVISSHRSGEGKSSEETLYWQSWPGNLHFCQRDEVEELLVWGKFQVIHQQVSIRKGYKKWPRIIFLNVTRAWLSAVWSVNKYDKWFSGRVLAVTSSHQAPPDIYYRIN